MRRFSFFCLLVLFGISCSKNTNQPSETISSSGYPLSEETSIGNAYPSFVEQEDSGNSALQIVEEEPLSEGFGIVRGSLHISLNNGKEPVIGARLYLAEVLKDDSGNERAAGFDRVESPTAITDDTGQFLFEGVSPGRYGLVLDTIINSYLLLIPEQTDGLIITVVGGEETYTGDLVYDSLPLSKQ